MSLKKTIAIPIFLSITITFNSCLLFRPSANKLTKRALLAHKQYDAIIVPGVPFIAPHWDLTMTMRVVWAVHLYKRGLTKKIIMFSLDFY
jgi:hypothetical protein